MRPLPLLFLLAIALLLPACNSAPRTDDADFVLVYLTSGPNSGQGDKDTRTKMFAGHMANIQRLADERSLLIAGPFSKPTDKTWRGILLLDVPTIEQAQALAQTDPGVQAGEFTPVCRPIRAATALRRTADLERALQADLKANPPPPPADPAKPAPPPGIRPYVMLTCEDLDRARIALETSPWKASTVWSARFTPPSPPSTRRGGVIVLDAEDPAPIRAGLRDAGACDIDGWWSTKSLVGLMAP